MQAKYVGVERGEVFSIGRSQRRFPKEATDCGLASSADLHPLFTFLAFPHGFRE
jgi:hypothetical protein